MPRSVLKARNADRDFIRLLAIGHNLGMATFVDYRGYRFPSEIIAQALWFYYRFTLSLRDIKDLLAKRAVTVS
jgi:hypothetical protein